MELKEITKTELFGEAVNKARKSRETYDDDVNIIASFVVEHLVGTEAYDEDIVLEVMDELYDRV